MSHGTPFVGAAVQHPDGTAGLIMRQAEEPSAATRSAALDPYADQETAFAKEMERMARQDAIALAQSHSEAEMDFQRMMQREGVVLAAAGQCPSYETPSLARDRALVAAVAAADAPLQRAMAVHAAGPNPIFADPSLLPTPGMEWLERMRAEDAAVTAAVKASDARLRPN